MGINEVISMNYRCSTIAWMKSCIQGIKACVGCFLSNFYFSQNDSPSKTMKMCFISSKKLFLFSRTKRVLFKFLYFCLHMSAIVLEVDPRKILMFMMSSIV